MLGRFCNSGTRVGAGVATVPSKKFWCPPPLKIKHFQSRLLTSKKSKTIEKDEEKIYFGVNVLDVNICFRFSLAAREEAGFATDIFIELKNLTIQGLANNDSHIIMRLLQIMGFVKE